MQTKSTLEQPSSLRHEQFCQKTAAEMHESFAPWPEAVPNTLEIAERCNVEIKLGELLLPKVPDPGQLRARGDAAPPRRGGLRRRYGDPVPAAATERLDMELGVISEMGFPSYFLIVWDFVRFAKDNGVAVGPGRGSAAGSIVAYSLGITDLDPLENDLLFERFLNPARRSITRHRHRLLRPRAQARDPLRAGEVRARVGRADHHLRQDGAARGDAGRGASPRLRLRDR